MVMTYSKPLKHGNVAGESAPEEDVLGQPEYPVFRLESDLWGLEVDFAPASDQREAPYPSIDRTKFSPGHLRLDAAGTSLELSGFQPGGVPSDSIADAISAPGIVAAQTTAQLTSGERQWDTSFGYGRAPTINCAIDFTSEQNTEHGASANMEAKLVEITAILIRTERVPMHALAELCTLFHDADTLPLDLRIGTNWNPQRLRELYVMEYHPHLNLIGRALHCDEDFGSAVNRRRTLGLLGTNASTFFTTSLLVSFLYAEELRL